MSVTRERLVAAVALVFCVLVMATSVEIGRTAIEAALSALTAYGTTVLLAALGLSLGIGQILKATKTVLTVAVVVALVLFALGKSVVGVFA